MKYFTLGIICIVLGLFISLFKDAEMKSVDRVEIQDGKLRTITDPMTSLKGINVLSFSGNNFLLAMIFSRSFEVNNCFIFRRAGETDTRVRRC